MSQELGSGYVTLLPSLRGFSKNLQTQLRKALRGVKADAETVPVSVKPEIDPVTATLRTELQRQLKAVTRKLALSVPVGPDTDGMRARLESQLTEMQRTLKMSIPTEPEEQTAYRNKLRGLIDSTKVTQKVDVDVETGRDRAGNAATRAGGRFSDLLSSGLGSATKAGGTFSDLFLRGFGSGLLNPVVGIPVLLATVLSLPAIGAAVSAATVLGGGLALLVMGAFGLRADEELKAALTGLAATANKTLTDAAQPLKGPFLESIGILAKAIEGMGPTLKEVFTLIGPSIPEVAKGLAGFMKSLQDTGALKALGQTIGPLFKQLSMALPDIGNAIAQFLISISKPETVQAFGVMLRVTADAIRLLGGFVGFLVGQFGALVTMVKAVITFVGYLVDGVKVIIGLFKGDKGAQQAVIDAAAGIHDFVVKVKQWWNDLWNSIGTKVSSTIGSVISTVGSLPGQIVAAVGNLGNLLFDAGKNVVQGLIDGIKSMLGGLGSMASNMAGTVRKYLPFSPAKEGPLSGSGNPYRSGQVIAGDLAAGVRSQLPVVASAASQLAGQLGVGGSASRAASVAGAAGITIDAEGDRWSQMLLALFKEVIRENGYGSDPVAALKS